MKLVDLHNHTSFSYDGSNTPEEVIEHAIAEKIDVIGITDHQFSVKDEFSEYCERLGRCKARYGGRIDMKCGLEIGTRPKPNDFLASNAHRLDFCLFESLDSPVGMDLFEFFEWRRLFSCPVGLAHTDIFSLSKRYGLNVPRELAKRDIFWEINTSGNYDYYYDFLTNDRKRALVRESRVMLSIGSDTHWIREYQGGKVRRANHLASELGNPVLFGE
jgi:histidinol phosphatase-like PHP family hydrolase